MSAVKGPAMISLSRRLKLFLPSLPLLPPMDHTMANRNVPCKTEEFRGHMSKFKGHMRVQRSHEPVERSHEQVQRSHAYSLSRKGDSDCLQ